jgi:hypothetical protein
MQNLLTRAPDASVTVMDNASLHKRFDMIDALEKAYGKLEF